MPRNTQKYQDQSLGGGDRFLTRDEIRNFKIKAHRGDQAAAVRLLEHSVKCQHRKLAFRRYFLSVELGAAISENALVYLKRISVDFSTEALNEIERLAISDLEMKATK
ncbi:hypothetical protein IQ03_04852 [Gemmobacter caeni]|uniref:Uncharacterized protein n=1 Tax=Gemmobacter caeni TaxID=589035 RepID=A0A2T6AG53_9RHOB|nr:hypothetical protein [Gemmobacter caeni]PTX42792.1 hypothetical protein C8N34_12513 [Gemmobacter caeni]TWI92434.1 hypothetical protein IQ03_04852 [Gemmobacter caeni]